MLQCKFCHQKLSLYDAAAHVCPESFDPIPVVSPATMELITELQNRINQLEERLEALEYRR